MNTTPRSRTLFRVLMAELGLARTGFGIRNDKVVSDSLSTSVVREASIPER